MSGHMWIQDNEGNSHPDDSILLAYVRRQLSITEAREVNEHLPRCQTCPAKCAQLKYIGDGLQHMLAYPMPTYPSIADRLDEQIASPAAARLALSERRQARLRKDVALGKALVMFTLKKLLGIHNQHTDQPRNRAMASVSVVSIPVLVILGLTVVAAVLAFTLNGHINAPTNRSQGSNGIGTPPVQPTILPPPTATLTPTPLPTQTATTATHVPGNNGAGRGKPILPTGNGNAIIYLCSSRGDLQQSRLNICGKNFKPGDKVALFEYIPGIGYRPKPPNVIADAQGTISAQWTITNCRTMPTSVYAIDLRTNAQTALVPVNVNVGNCQPNVKPRSPGKN